MISTNGVSWVRYDRLMLIGIGLIVIGMVLVVLSVSLSLFTPGVFSIGLGLLCCAASGISYLAWPPAGRAPEEP